jgi:hypothetical protein
MKTALFTVVAAAVITAAAGAASADTVNVKYLGTGKGSNVKIIAPGVNQNVFAGQLNHQISGGTGLGAILNGTYATYCADITQYVTSTTKTYTVVPIEQVPNVSPMGLSKADALRNLYSFGAGVQLTNAASNDFAAAFQIAVWEVVSDFNSNLGLTSLSVTDGSFKAKSTNGNALSAGIMNNLNTIFSGIFNLPEGTVPVEIAGISHATAQDQIVVVPTPGALALAGLGGGLLIKRRRKA